jgi:hypothetical protein
MNTQCGTPSTTNLWFRKTLSLLLCAAALTACGGGDDETEVRLINATSDIESLDMTADNDDMDETRIFASVARDGQSEYTNLDDASYTVRLKRAGATATSASASVSLNNEQRHTLVAYGREGSLRVTTLSDEEDEPSSGQLKLRIFNTSSDTGAVDVYLTEASTSIDGVAPTFSAVAASSMSGFSEVTRGTYRLRVTAKDDKSDIRLDLSDVVLGDKEIVTLLLRSGSGGVLVHALISQQQGSLAARKNLSARARLVAAVTSNGQVSASVGETPLNVNMRSPSAGDYVLVPAGAQTVDVSVNAAAAFRDSMTFEAGADYTLMVYGEASASSVKAISDDNRLPTSSTRAKMRLVHLVSETNSNLTLTKDYSVVASNTPYGEASAYTQVDSATDARIEVTASSSASPLYLNEEVSIVEKGIYSIFMLGDLASPLGVLRRDR